MKIEVLLGLCALLVMLWSMAIIDEAHVDIIKSHQKLINDCEQNLSRDQHCQLIAIPENSNER